MKNKFFFYILLFAGLLVEVSASAQTGKERIDKLYSSSGIGFSIPVGEASQYLQPKFSTTLGLNLGLGNKGLFLYPKASLHAYKFDQQALEPGFTTLIKNGRATTYLLNLALGYRKMTGNFGYYGFIGGGGGFILTPQVELSSGNDVATVSNKNNGMTMLETGLGIEYGLGKVSVFLESSYMHGFNKLQNRQFQSVPLSIGIKPNLSTLIYGSK